MRKALVVMLFTAAVSGPLVAQRGDPPFEGPRGAFSFEMSDGEPISQFLEWSRELELSDEQRNRLMELRRRLRSQNAGHMSRLDSLRDLAGVDMTERGRLTQKDRDALARFEQWAKPVVDSIRANNDAARVEARLLLADVQRVRMDSLVTHTRERRPARGGRRPPSAPLRRHPVRPG